MNTFPIHSSWCEFEPGSFFSLRSGSEQWLSFESIGTLVQEIALAALAVLVFLITFGAVTSFGETRSSTETSNYGLSTTVAPPRPTALSLPYLTEIECPVCMEDPFRETSARSYTWSGHAVVAPSGRHQIIHGICAKCLPRVPAGGVPNCYTCRAPLPRGLQQITIYRDGSTS